MTGITLEMAQARLEKYLAAEEKILLGQAVDMDGVRLTRANLADVQQGVTLWNKRVNMLTNSGRMQVREVIPR